MLCKVCNKAHELNACEYNDPEYKKIISKYKNKNENDITNDEFTEFVRMVEDNKKSVIRSDWIIVDVKILREYL